MISFKQYLTEILDGPKDLYSVHTVIDGFNKHYGNRIVTAFTAAWSSKTLAKENMYVVRYMVSSDHMFEYHIVNQDIGVASNMTKKPTGRYWIDALSIVKNDIEKNIVKRQFKIQIFNVDMYNSLISICRRLLIKYPDMEITEVGRKPDIDNKFSGGLNTFYILKKNVKKLNVPIFKLK